MLQSTGITRVKGPSLGFYRWHSLMDGIHSMPHLLNLMGWDESDGWIDPTEKHQSSNNLALWYECHYRKLLALWIEPKRILATLWSKIVICIDWRALITVCTTCFELAVASVCSSRAVPCKAHCSSTGGACSKPWRLQNDLICITI